MNEQNYASLEASKRLVEAGIVIPSEFCWFLDVCSATGWSLNRCFEKLPGPDCYFAPSMAEAWRELPMLFGTVRPVLSCRPIYRPTIEKYNDSSISFYQWKDIIKDDFYSENTNPVDALIDLLIWVEKEAKT